MNELHLKYRPNTLDRVVGNAVAVAELKSRIASKTIPHAILFIGPTGCGKTTLARIIRDELECHALDFCELNSAMFRGIDSIRDIQSRMRNSPACGPVRVWLLDEVHMLTKEAQNAALKMLEDTPPHVYFLLCTTDPDKLIPTLAGRPLPIVVKLASDDEMAALLDRVAKKEKITLADAIKTDIITSAGGCYRVALVLLEKIANVPANMQSAAVAQRAAELNESIDLCRALIEQKPWKTIAAIIKNLRAEPEQIRWAVIMYARAVLLSTGRWQAYNVITAFSGNFYDTKSAGLAAAAYEAVNAKEN